MITEIQGKQNEQPDFSVQFPEDSSLLEGVKEWEGESLPSHQETLLITNWDQKSGKIV